MAVQAQFYPDNLGLQLLPMCGQQQDWNSVNPVLLPHPPLSVLHPVNHLWFNLHDQNHPLFSQQTHQNQNFLGINNYPPMAFSQSLDPLFQSQRQEIESLLQIQNESLKSALQHQRNHQLKLLLKGIESRAVKLMKQKEQALAEARNKTMVLESRLRKAKMESDSWQQVARENEAMVADLSSMLEQVKEKMELVSSSNRAVDAASSCGDAASFCGDGEDQERSTSSWSKMVACRGCNSLRSCVLFLPCRHLCSCKNCEAFLSSCPVCKSVKEASLEVFWI